jgi:hypothetical protein
MESRKSMRKIRLIQWVVLVTQRRELSHRIVVARSCIWDAVRLVVEHEWRSTQATGNLWWFYVGVVLGVCLHSAQTTDRNHIRPGQAFLANMRVPVSVHGITRRQTEVQSVKVSHALLVESVHGSRSRGLNGGPHIPVKLSLNTVGLQRVGRKQARDELHHQLNDLRVERSL